MRADTVLRLIDAARPPTPKVGIVTAVGATTVDVRLSASGVTEGLQYNPALVPVVGDRVLVMPADTTWVVLCKVSPQPTLVPDEEVRVKPTRLWTKARAATLESIPAGTWYDQWESASSGYPAQYTQGRFAEASGGPGWVPRYSDWASVGYYGALASLVPSGATITSVSLGLKRTTGGQVGAPTVPPVLYGHAHDIANPPVTAAAPSWVTGYGPVKYPGVRLGETTRLMLPGAFVTGLLTSTIKGIGFWSDRTEDAAPFWQAIDGGELIIGYTQPAA